MICVFQWECTDSGEYWYIKIYEKEIFDTPLCIVAHSEDRIVNFVCTGQTLLTTATMAVDLSAQDILNLGETLLESRRLFTSPTFSCGEQVTA